MMTQTPQRLDGVTRQIDKLRVEVNTMLRALPDEAPLMAAVDVVTALNYLKLAVVSLDQAADQLDPRLLTGAAQNIVMGAEDISDAVEVYANTVPDEPEPDTPDDDPMSDHVKRNVHRGIRTMLAQAPAHTWTVDEARAVWEALAGVLHRRTVSGNARRPR